MLNGLGWRPVPRGVEGLTRNMIRISTIFIAICMVLVAASLGLILYSVAGISGLESAIVALTALTFLILYNAVSMRLRDRTDVGSQIADLFLADDQGRRQRQGVAGDAHHQVVIEEGAVERVEAAFARLVRT